MKNLFSQSIKVLLIYLVSITSFADNKAPGGIVFFTVDGVGSGHKMISVAIEKATLRRALELTKQGDKSVYVNPHPVLLNHFLTPRMQKIFGKQYVQFAQDHPTVHELVYTHGAKLTTLEIRNLIVHAFISRELAEALMADKPGTIVSDMPLLPQMIDAMKTKGWIPASVKSIQAVTDNAVTPVYNSPGLVILPHPDLTQEMTKVGKDPAYIASVRGIPVRPEFLEPFDRREVRVRLNADLGEILQNEIKDPEVLSQLDLRNPLGNIDQTLMFVSGGGEGIGIDKFLKFLPDWRPDEPVTVILVCGKNEDAYLKALELIKKGKTPFNVTLIPRPFVTVGMDLLKKAADFSIEKPGGSATAEAFALRLPQYVHMSLAGQEGRNLEFLTQRGVLGRIKLTDLNNISALKSRSDEMRAAQINEFPDLASVPDQIADLIITHAMDTQHAAPETFTNILPRVLARACKYLLEKF